MRTTFALHLLLVLLVIGLTGCQPAALPPQPQAGPTNTTEPPSAKQWSVNLTVTGGFAGIHKVMELSSDGSYQLTDMRTGENKKSSLSESELNKISTLVEQIQGGQDPYPSVCADCFIYELAVQKGKETYRLTLDDINLSDSEAAPLIEELIALGRLSTP